MLIKCHNCKQEIGDQMLVVVVYYGDSQEWCYRCAGYDQWKKAFEPSAHWRSKMFESPSCADMALGSGVLGTLRGGSGAIYSGHIGFMSIASGALMVMSGTGPTMPVSRQIMSGFLISDAESSRDEQYSTLNEIRRLAAAGPPLIADPRFLITDLEED